MSAFSIINKDRSNSTVDDKIEQSGLGTLSNLPGEIRNHIYRNILLSVDDIFVTKKNIHERTELLRTSSTIRRETSSVFLAENTFVAPASDSDNVKCFDSLIDLLSQVKKPANAAKFRRQAKKSPFYTASQFDVGKLLVRISTFGMYNVTVGSTFLAAIMAVGRDNVMQARSKCLLEGRDVQSEPNYRGVAFLYEHLGVVLRVTASFEQLKPAMLDDFAYTDVQCTMQ